MYQSLPVGMLKTAQNPTINIPSISTATDLSGAVGPRNTLHRHSMADIISHKNALARKLDCQLSIEGSGQNNITAARISMTTTPLIQLIFFMCLPYSNILFRMRSNLFTIGRRAFDSA